MENSLVSTDTKLKTNRLLLRYPRLEDAPEIFSVVQSPKFPEQLPLKEMDTLSRIENWLKRLGEFWETGKAYSWIMEDHASENLIGQVTLSKVEGDQKWVLAFWTDPDQWGKGYATEGANRVIKFGFQELGAKKIWAAAGKWNKGSNRVLEKLGMVYLGDNPEGYFAKEKPIPTREYEISQVNWQSRKINNFQQDKKSGCVRIPIFGNRATI